MLTLMDKLIKQLADGQRVEVECCSLIPSEGEGLIWGVDPYGIDFIACNRFVKGNAKLAREAVEHAVRVGKGDNPHDRAYDRPSEA